MGFGMKKSKSGFTLIELLIVMVILGLLASLVGPKMFGKLGMAKQKTAKTQIEMLMSAMDGFRHDVGRYPTQQEGMTALDVGCAVGGAVFELARTFESVTGVDYSAAFVGAAKGAARVLDSRSGELLAAVADRQVGGGHIKAAAQWTLGDAENAINLWAARAANQLYAWTSGAQTPR